MTTPLPVGPATPYISPELLVQAPTGISWSSIPAGSQVSPAQRLAEQSNICARATAMVDRACNQPLRATVDTLPLYGPGVRVGVPGNGAPAELVLKRWPVLEVISIQVAPNVLPWVFSTVPSTAWAIKYPVSGLYGTTVPTAAAEGGQTVLLDPAWLNGNASSVPAGPGWAPSWGHNQYVIQVAYINGWPHSGLTAAAAAGATTLAVDDCTGWVITSPFTGTLTGATGTVYDANYQEVIQVASASATQGPGTLTLAAPLQFAHDSGVIVSTLPETVSWAAILFGCSVALERGATATGVMQVPGHMLPNGSSGDPAKDAECLLSDFARII